MCPASPSLPQTPAFTIRLPDGSVGRASRVTPKGMRLQSRVHWTVGQKVVLELVPPGWRTRISAAGVVSTVTASGGTSTATIRFTALRVHARD